MLKKEFVLKKLEQVFSFMQNNPTMEIWKRATNLAYSMISNENRYKEIDMCKDNKLDYLCKRIIHAEY